MEKRRPAGIAAIGRTKAVDPHHVEALLSALPKAELHLHLEGAIDPTIVVELAARRGASVPIEEAERRYHFQDFTGFLEAYKWVTSLLSKPDDYALITRHLTDQLLSQNVLYAEVTLSVGVMLRRHQDVAANFAAIRQAAERAQAKGLRLQWIFDAVRQFDLEEAMEVARHATAMKSEGVVAFGLGGDELALPAKDFRRVYEFAGTAGLHRLIHVGELGSAQHVRQAVELLAVERIGHGIAAMHDEPTMDLLVARQIPLEICPASNLCTGALARQLGQKEARVKDHPLRQFLRRGLSVTLSTDDPAMFRTNLTAEYRLAHTLGLTLGELVRLAEMSFQHAFLPPDEKKSLIEAFRAKTKLLGLL